MVANLEKLRDGKGWSRQKLIDEVGLDLTVKKIYSYERLDIEPSFEVLIALADKFQVTVDFLLGRTSDCFSYKEPLTTLCLERFGERIKAYREEKKLSRREVSEAAGITTAYLLLIEMKGKVPKLETAIKILNALELSADYAFMDSLVTGVATKCNYLQDKIDHLSHEQKQVILNLMETMIEQI